MRLAIVFSLLCAQILMCRANNELSSGFADPPHEAKPHTWWHWNKDDQPLPSGLMGPVRLLFKMESKESNE